MVKSAEVIIIGAGVIGCSIAYHLAKVGCRDLIVLEKDSIGSGSTDKCPGGIRQQFSTEINIRLSMESVNFFEHFGEETGHPADFRQHGYLMLATTPDEMETFRQNVALQQSLGVKVYLLSPQEAREIVPQLNVEDVRGATFCPSDGYADPYSVVQGFASVAKKSGARIYEETEVIGIRMRGNQVQGVLTSKGDFAAPVVVNAAGAYAAQVGKMADIDIPIRPLRRHLFVTAPTNGLSKKTPMVVDFHNGFWFRKEGLAVIFGMRNPDEPEGFDISVDWQFLANSLARAASHRLPFLIDTGVARGQAGLHSDTPDCNAILGEAAEIKGFYLACGFSGHGFMHSPAVGRIIADLISGQKSHLDLSPLSPQRFKALACEKEKCFI